jgi:iron complex outermembrane recepter protein
MRRDAHNLLRCASGLALATAVFAACPALAQDEQTDVIVTGTRTSGLKAIDSAAPVQVIDSLSLKRVGQPDLSQALAQTVPSFTAQAFGGDMANQTLSVRLRGISPNHTLILVNGKRRHGSSALSVLSSPYQGSAAPDLSFLPIGAIDHVEVLTDGAAAQYGTDAIAGVINIILKDDNAGGSLTVSGGGYFDGDGTTADIMANFGFTPNDKSFVNLTYESKYHGYSDRGGADPRATPNTSGTFDDAGRWIGGAYDTTTPGFPYVNHIFGDATQRLNVLAYNAGYDLTDTWSLYSFGTYGLKKAASYENWRHPTRVSKVVNGTTVYPFPQGFHPHEMLDESDLSLTFGIDGTIGDGWNVDIASTYGRDDQQIYNYGSINASLYADTGFSPTDFYIGAFIGTQLTNQIDVTKEFEVGMAKPMTLAFGFEQRHETYEIMQGDEASTYKEGSQAFPGFSDTDAGTYERDNEAAYVDLTLYPLDNWVVDTALRYEHYSDFGDTTVGKITSRYDFSDRFAIRGTASTGFRAPTMAEEHYSATNVSPTSAFVQLPPNSAAASILGLDALKPEKSTNFSVGFVAHPIPGMTLTVDAYQIAITDRIIGSGAVFSAGNPSGNDYAEVAAAIAANGNILDPTVSQFGINVFTNGADTTTTGVEFVAAFPSVATDKMGRFDWSLSGNYAKTEIDEILQASSVIATSDLFDQEAKSILEHSAPEFTLKGNLIWSLGKWTVALKETLYGSSYLIQQGDDGIWYKSKVPTTAITDIDIAYKVTSSVKLQVGANNLFDEMPEKRNPGLLKSFIDANDNAAVGQYPSWSPYGFNGGYYYAKLTVNF